MFAKQPAKPKTDKAVSASGAPVAADQRKVPRVASLIADDVTFEGNVTSEGELHVDGAIRGDVTVGKLVLGETGHIQGNVFAEGAEIRGRVVGAITAQAVRLYATAHIDGDITHEQLSIEPGAFFQGRSQKLQRIAAAESDTPASDVITLKAAAGG